MRDPRGGPNNLRSTRCASLCPEDERTEGRELEEPRDDGEHDHTGARGERDHRAEPLIYRLPRRPCDDLYDPVLAAPDASHDVLAADHRGGAVAACGPALAGTPPSASGELS